jgi:hypothetical protein
MKTNKPTEVESEEMFFAKCNLADSLQARHVATAVRLTIARLGQVTPSFIHAGDTFEDLDSLPFWKSCGDVGFETDTLAKELQKNIGVNLTDSQLSEIRDPDINARMTIAEFVRDVWAVVEKTRIPGIPPP